MCEETFLRISSLREHVKLQHKNSECKTKIYSQRNYSMLKTDIKNLQCSKCTQACTELEALKTHLTSAHGIKFHLADSLLVPFRVDDGLYECVKCNDSFKSFTALSKHTNLHYSNFVCDSCGSVFYCYRTMQNHINRMHKEVRCTICNMKFKTMSAKDKHLRTTHKVKYKNYCPYCSEIFKSGYRKMLHLTEVHGIKRPEFKCGYCGKIFTETGQMNNHIREVHKGEKSKICSVCSKGFFRTADLKRHERIHEPIREKKFSCEVCNSKFKDKYSYSRHLRKKLHEKIDFKTALTRDTTSH